MDVACHGIPSHADVRRCHDVAWTFHGATSSDVMLLCSGINKPVAVLSWYMTAKPTEDYIIIVDADMIIMKPFDPVQMGVKPGSIPKSCCLASAWEILRPHTGPT